MLTWSEGPFFLEWQLSTCVSLTWGTHGKVLKFIWMFLRSTPPTQDLLQIMYTP